MSLSTKLLEEFDEVITDRGYNSRSKAIRDALKDYILRYQWLNEIGGERNGVIAVIYDYHFTGVLENLTNAQHKSREYINAVMQVHITQKYCMEVIVVKGDIKHIRELTDKIKSLNGVEYVKLTSISSGNKTILER